MELRRCLSLVLLATFLMTVRVQGVRLSFSPSTIVDGKTPTLTVRCDTDAAASDTVYAIRIIKPPGGTNLAIVDSNGARVTDTTIQQRATATGTVNPAAGSNLVLNFNDAITCSDAGEYSCLLLSANTQNQVANQTLQATSDPHSIEMVVRPTMFTYSVNDSVEIVCSGFIGKPATGTPLGSWVWEVRDDAFGSTWTSLRPGLVPVDETPTSSGLCQMNGRSSLRFQLQMEDDNRMYRCYFRDSQHSANFTFNLIGTSTPNPAGNTDPAQGSTGMIVGIVLGVLAFIAIVIVLVYFFVFRRKGSKGSDYDTGEGKNGPEAHTDAELHGNPVYTLPSTHPKYGVDNQAMDGNSDAHDQDPNDRHGRSRRDPYANEGRRGRDRHDRDHDRHDRYQPEEAPYPESRSYDHSFEDDGTDNRGYVPPEAIGSAV